MEKAQHPGRPGTASKVRRGKLERGSRGNAPTGGEDRGGEEGNGRMRRTGSAPAKRWCSGSCAGPGAPASRDPHLAKAEAAATGPPELPGINPQKGGTRGRGGRNLAAGPHWPAPRPTAAPGEGCPGGRGPYAARPSARSDPGSFPPLCYACLPSHSLSTFSPSFQPPPKNFLLYPVPDAPSGQILHTSQGSTP